MLEKDLYPTHMAKYVIMNIKAKHSHDKFSFSASLIPFGIGVDIHVAFPRMMILKYYNFLIEGAEYGPRYIA